ncbi:MAG TPA: ATP-binding protein [Fimbriimonas sp.]|nr:ATP-binding protein [Fimbriimonas sp.]
MGIYIDVAKPVSGEELFVASADADALERRLSLLKEAGQRLSRSLDPKKLFATLTELVCEVLPCDGLVVSSYTSSDEMIRCVYAWAGGQVHDHSGFPALSLSHDGKGMQSQVIIEKKARAFNVTEKVRQRSDGHYTEMSDSGTLEPIVERDPQAKWALMCPMILDDEVTGVVQVMSDSGHAYTRNDLELLQFLVHQLAPAVHNSTLYTRLQLEHENRIAAEKALGESERRFQLLFDSLPLIAWAINAKTLAQEYLNQHYYEYTGLDEATPGWSGWNLVVHPDDRPDAQERVTHCFETGETWEQEIRLRRHDGVYRWHLSRMVPVRDDKGQIDRWLGISTEIHQQKTAEAELERRVDERTREMQQAIQELEGFTYSVSHDLRAPLRSIVATSVMIEQDYGSALPGEAASLLQRQAAAAKKMAVLIDELLGLSRIARQQISVTRIDLAALVKEVIAELEHDGRASGIKFEVAEPLTGMADARLMRLALSNLLDNAAKFSPEGGRVIVGRKGKSYFVQDEGIGFDMTYEDRLFRPFERLVQDAHYPGTGIGLANVKRIIERHGGSVWAESQPGKGSTFYFTLGSA